MNRIKRRIPFSIILLAGMLSASILFSCDEEKPEAGFDLLYQGFSQSSGFDYSFGINDIGEEKSVEFTIKNSGTLDTTIESISWTTVSNDGQFTLNTGSVNKTLEPDETTGFSVTFKPSVSGNFSGSLSIRHSVWPGEYILKVSGYTADKWQKLSAGSETDKFYGRSVAADGNYVIVGATDSGGRGNGIGAAYIYERDGIVLPGAVSRVTAPGSEADEKDYFGTSVAISGDYAIVGAYGDTEAAGDNSGSAYIYVRSSANNWDFSQKLLAPDAGEHDKFGVSVALVGDYAVVGAKSNDEAADQGGAVYCYKRNGSSWDLIQKITAADANEWGCFGHAVAMDGNNLIVGAYGNNQAGDWAGAVYFYSRSGDSWNLVNEVIPSGLTEKSKFGVAVDIYGEYAIVGAPALKVSDDTTGAAFIYKYNGSDSWVQVAQLSEASRFEFAFGAAVSINDSYAIAGSYNGTGNNLDLAGAAYLYGKNGDSWEPVIKLISPDASKSDEFGRAFALMDEYVLIGAYEAFEDTGAVYMYFY
ncbi:MAG: choice-of-anchor D domain-containing protein [bacterium]|nr:choice-of-anchor D domain-containing protein [bacterium]